jgi:hypothetical protein
MFPKTTAILFPNLNLIFLSIITEIGTINLSHFKTLFCEGCNAKILAIKEGKIPIESSYLIDII